MGTYGPFFILIAARSNRRTGCQTAKMAAKDPSSAYAQLVATVNNRNWDELPDHLCAELMYNGDKITRQEWITQLRDTISAMPDVKTELDQLIPDRKGDSLGVRLIHKATLAKPFRGAQVTNKPIEWTELVFCWFQEGKLAKCINLTDIDTFRRGDTKAVPSSTIQQRPAPTGLDLGQTYHDYIASINRLTMKEEFPRFCQPKVTHNMHSYTMDEYREMIESSFQQIKGLHFTVEELIVDEKSQQVAARLGFTGHPVEEFVGIKPTGKDVRFHEHAFYKLDEGKVTWVWSLLNLEAYRECLAG